MSTTSDSSVSFSQTDTRSDEMHSTIEQWIDELVAGVDDAQASEEFQEWLDVQSRFHDYSYRNTLLIKRQYPEATKVAGYRTWQEEFDRHVQEGESAIWIWAPIITKQCPECGNSRSYHESSDCNDQTPRKLPYSTPSALRASVLEGRALMWTPGNQSSAIGW
ncbi:hypothetical protein SAMN05216564_11214 [Halopenitus persicus]|uniref:N-terminal domain-containing protein n=1 Tax=Halopenitus persicus TaxID=1048396 RepID=A0A1H3N9S0_9EURY|nr:hypothetical protein SAMN05216564_11214 [Halopenitus persicus]